MVKIVFNLTLENLGSYALFREVYFFARLYYTAKCDLMRSINALTDIDFLIKQNELRLDNIVLASFS